MQLRGQTHVPLLLLLVMYCTYNCLAMETHLKCSACEAVAAELQRRLEAELPRQQLDLRHRLDKDGQRYGKVIDWRLSEIRAVNLLEDLCEDMKDYTLVATNTSTETADQQPQLQQQHVWVKYRGEGSSTVDDDERPDKPEEELRKKQLTSFCGLLLESHEEEVVEALMTEQFAGGVTPVLCQKITTRCKGKVYSTQTVSAENSRDQDSSSSSSDGDSGSRRSTAGDEL